MDRFVPLSATTSTLGAHLAPDEEILTLQEHVGLYHGAHKAKRQPDGTLYLSSHRIIYVDHFAPLYHSCALSLALVRQTEYYAGFLKSSPKITLKLEPPPTSLVAQQNQPPRRKEPGADERGTTGAEAGSSSAKPTLVAPKSWICPVCGFSNSDTDKCSLCGIPFEKSSAKRGTKMAATIPGLPAPPAALPSSQSSSYLATESLPGSASTKPRPSDPVPCPTCTFLNHPSMGACELCNTPLPGAHMGKSLNRHASSSALPDGDTSSSRAKSARTRTISTSAGASPRPDRDSDGEGEDEDENQDGDEPLLPVSDPAIEHVKLSFRKGGDKAFYELLRTTLRQKAWQIQHAPPSSRNRTDSASQQTPSTTRPPALPSANISSPAPSVPSFATTIDIDGRRVPLSLLRRDGLNTPAAGLSAQGGSSSPATPMRSSAGIEAILRSTSLSHTQASTNMLSALADLEALQKRAKNMVEMAEKLNAQLSRLEAEDRAKNSARNGSSGAAVDNHSATLIRSSLVMLGLPSPAVTEDMVAERGLYELELARELAGLLLSGVPDRSAAKQHQKQAGLMGHGRVLARGKERSVDEVRHMERAEEDLRLLSQSNAAALVELVEDKVSRVQVVGAEEEEELERVLAESTGEQGGRELIGLDEVWCVWNRARGVALVPPSDLRACAVHLPRLTEPPVRLRVFPSTSSAASSKKSSGSSPSGLCVLHMPRYSESAFEARVLARLRFARRRSPRQPFGVGLSAFELASREGAPVVLIEQMLTGIEMGLNASIVRDEGGAAPRGGGGGGGSSSSSGGTRRAGVLAATGGPNTRWFENEFQRAAESVKAYRSAAVTPFV
ncbi:Vacuolar protein-sorting-associated protein 36 [Tilletia horrida]|nr:Vacuolar protein-sorting-associated protein 36 [Tilletia horrida]